MIAGFFANAWGKIVVIAGVVFAILAGLFKVYGAGKTAAKSEAQEKQLENVATRQDVDSAVAGSGADANRQRLRDKFTRG